MGISEPAPESDLSGAWRCVVTIRFLDTNRVVPAIGSNALQALELAIDYVRLEEWRIVLEYGLRLLNASTLEPEFDEAELKIYLSNPPKLAPNNGAPRPRS